MGTTTTSTALRRARRNGKVHLRLAEVDAHASRVRLERIHRQARQPRQTGPAA